MINSFTGFYRPLSNFHPCQVTLDGVTYPSVEHAYVAAKTIDPYWRQRVLECETPGKAKRLGRRLPLREDWEQVKFQIMMDLVKQKFNDPGLAKMLLSTGDQYLAEGNTWGDTYWGVCDGVGKNCLGFILMRVRAELKM